MSEAVGPNFFRERRATVAGGVEGGGGGGLGSGDWESLCATTVDGVVRRLRVNTQFRLALCGSREGISEDMALL